MSLCSAYGRFSLPLKSVITLIFLFLGLLAWHSAYIEAIHSEINDFEQDYALGCSLRTKTDPGKSIPDLIKLCDPTAKAVFTYEQTPHPLILALPYSVFTYLSLISAKELYFFLQLGFACILSALIPMITIGRMSWRGSLLLLIFLALARPMWTVLALGNLSLVLLVLSILACLWIKKGGEGKGGFLLGLVMAAKLTILPLIGLLLLTRKWRALIVSITVFIGSLIVTILLFGTSATQKHLFVTIPREEIRWRDEIANQSLLSWGSRIFEGVVAAQKKSGPVEVSELFTAESWARPAGFVLLAFFVVGLIYSTRRFSFNTSWPIFLAASAIVIPISWEHTLLLALPLYALLAHAVYLSEEIRLELGYLILVLSYAFGTNVLGFFAAKDGVLPFWINFLLLLPQLSLIVAIFWYAGILRARSSLKA